MAIVPSISGPQIRIGRLNGEAAGALAPERKTVHLFAEFESERVE